MGSGELSWQDGLLRWFQLLPSAFLSSPHFRFIHVNSTAKLSKNCLLERCLSMLTSRVTGRSAAAKTVFSALQGAIFQRRGTRYLSPTYPPKIADCRAVVTFQLVRRQGGYHSVPFTFSTFKTGRTSAALGGARPRHTPPAFGIFKSGRISAASNLSANGTLER